MKPAMRAYQAGVLPGGGGRDKTCASPSRLIMQARAVIALLALAVIAVLVRRDFPPLVDWPDHMARHYLEALWLKGESLPSFYEIAYRVMPNLGSDLIVPPLLLAFDHITASKIFLILAVLLFSAGPMLFVLQYGRHSPQAYAAAAALMPWVLAGTFFWGFMNYYSGVGLAFLAAANHLRLLRKERPGVIQLAGHAGLLLLLYVWHLTSIGIFLVLAGCMTLDILWTNGRKAFIHSIVRLLPVTATILPAIAVMIAVFLTPQLNALSGGVVWSTPLRKIALAAGYFSAYDVRLDLALSAVWVLGLALLFRLPALRPLRIDYAGLSFLAFGLLYLVLPVEVGTTSGADIRMLPSLLFTGAALLANLPLSRLAPLGLAALLAAGGVRYASIDSAWARMEGDARAIDAHFAREKANAKILVVTLDRASKTSFQSHLAGWAVPRNLAYVSNLFSYAGQQTLSLKGPKIEPVALADGGYAIDEALVRTSFDYVYLFNPAGAKFAIPAGWTFVLGEGAGRLYRIAR